MPSGFELVILDVQLAIVIACYNCVCAFSRHSAACSAVFTWPKYCVLSGGRSEYSHCPLASKGKAWGGWVVWSWCLLGFSHLLEISGGYRAHWKDIVIVCISTGLRTSQDPGGAGKCGYLAAVWLVAESGWSIYYVIVVVFLTHIVSGMEHRKHISY